MRHFSAFLRQLRDMKDRASGLEAEVHYARLDAVLNALAKRQSWMTYRDLGQVLGVFSSKLGAMLGRRMQDDHADGEPLSSSLIVNKNTKISSPGFFDMARSLGYSVHDERQFWLEQRERCYDKFNQATISMMLNSGLTDEEQEKVERADRDIANAMLQAGVTDRAFWIGEIANGQRVIRFRTAHRVIFEMVEAGFARLSESELAAHVSRSLLS